MGVTAMSSANEIATKLEMALGGLPETVPPGFRTLAQWASIWGRSMNYTYRLIKGHVKTGRMEEKKIRVATASYKSYPIWHYKAVK